MKGTDSTPQSPIPVLTETEKNLLHEQGVSIKISESVPNTGMIEFGGKTFNVRLANSDLSLQATDLEHLAGKVALLLISKQLLNETFNGARINQAGIQNLEGHQLTTFDQQGDPAMKMYQELTHFVSQRIFSPPPSTNALEESAQLETESPKPQKMNSDQQAFFETVRLAYGKMNDRFQQAKQKPNADESKKIIENEIKWIDKKLKDIEHANTFPGLEGEEVKEMALKWAEQLHDLKIQMQDQLKIYEKKTTSEKSDNVVYRQTFETLVKVSKKLTEKSKSLKLTMGNGQPGLVKRELGLKARKGKSETAQQTAQHVISHLRTCLNQKVFTQDDIPDLIALKNNLSHQLSALDHLPALKEEFEAVFDLIDKAKSSFPRPETYVDKIKSSLEQEGKILTMETLIPFLLQIDQTHLREDFLAGAGWLSFIRKDDGTNIGLLVKEMIHIFEQHADNEQLAKVNGNPLYSLNSQVVEEKKVILDLAVELVKRGMVKKEAFDKLLALAEKDTNFTIQGDESGRYAAALASATANIPPSATTIVSEMEVQNPNLDLSERFSALAKKKMSAKEEEQFISDFMSDLHAISSNMFKAIQPKEFYGQAWNKGSIEDKRTHAPNITTNIAFFNQVSKFVSREILMNPTYTPKERARVYEAFVKMADRFTREKPRNYEMCAAICAALTSSAVLNTIKHEPLSEEAKMTLSRLEILLSTNSNSKLLRETYKANQEQQISYMPKIGIYLTDLTFTDDGIPDTIGEEASLNLKKLKLLGEQQRRIESESAALPSHQSLHFDLNEQILQAKLPSEDELYARKNELYPTGSKAQTQAKTVTASPSQMASYLMQTRPDETYQALASFFNNRQSVLILTEGGHLTTVPLDDKFKLKKSHVREQVSNALHATAEILFELAKKGENIIPGTTEDRLLLLLSRLSSREPTKTMIEKDPNLTNLFQALETFIAFRDQLSERQKWSDFFDSSDFQNAFQQLIRDNPEHEIEIYTEGHKIKVKDYQKEVVDRYRQNYAKIKVDFEQLMKGDIHSDKIAEQLQALNKFARTQVYPYAEMMNDLAKELIKQNASRNHIDLLDPEKQAIKDEFVNGKLEEIEARFKAFI